MNNVGSPKKVLLAEDDLWVLEGWLRGVSDVGFDFAGRDFPTVLDQATIGLAVLSYGPHQLHIARTLPTVEKAVQEHSYDACFMDGVLLKTKATDSNVGTYDVVADLLKASQGPKVYLISSAAQAQVELLQNSYKLDIDRLRAEGRVAGSVKGYSTNQRILAPIFGFEVPDFRKKDQKPPTPSSPV